MFANNQLDVLVCPSAGSPALEDLRAHSRELLLDPETYGGPPNPMQFTVPWVRKQLARLVFPSSVALTALGRCRTTQDTRR